MITQTAARPWRLTCRRLRLRPYWLGPKVEPNPRPYARTAPHLRGRVFKSGGTWHMQVVNTSTGDVLASDNTNNYYVMAEEAVVATASARAAWMFEFKRKELQA